jgi:nicotinate-nucleotide adenylyltransferase
VSLPRAGRLARLPPHGADQRIGLFGGSFDPAHAGHAAVVRTALARLRLDRLWVLVTPGNPLKARTLPPASERAARAREVLGRARVDVTEFEAAAGLLYTRDVARYLVRRAPGVRFVWIMGADVLAELHRWRDWRGFARIMPFAVVDRPGASLVALQAPAAQTLARRRMPEAEAAALAEARPPAWTFLHAPRVRLSSTDLRRVRSASTPREASAAGDMDGRRRP